VGVVRVEENEPVTPRPDQHRAAKAWDAEYAAGRYRDEPPLPFVADILAAAREHDLLGAEGLYIGGGNGRNYLPLVAGGLDLVGLDVSTAALSQLVELAPQRRERLVHGVGTDLEYAHEVPESDDDGGFTVRYLDGPKRGLQIRFFAESELAALFNGYNRVLAPRRACTWRMPRERGRWSQWEAIFRKTF
jgi:hypothetical protein